MLPLSSMQLDNATSMDEIDQIIDLPESAAILNCSGWSIVEPVTMGNRYRLIECLIKEEVISKRETNLKAFFRGLNLLNVGDLIVAHPKIMEPVFVFKHDKLTADSFMALVGSVKPPSPTHSRAFGFFRDYVCYLEGILLVYVLLPLSISTLNLWG